MTGIYWWNPLVWWARHAVREAEERCCDAWVVRTFPDRTFKYASAILETLDCLAGAAVLEPIGGTGLSSATQLKKRLIEILRGSTPQHLSRPATTAFLGVGAMALAIGPVVALPPSYQAMNLGSLGGQIVTGFRLNDRGQVIGWATVGDNPKDPVRRRFAFHAFRTAPNRSIDPASDDLAILLGDKVPASVQEYPGVRHQQPWPGDRFGPDRSASIHLVQSAVRSCLPGRRTPRHRDRPRTGTHATSHQRLVADFRVHPATGTRFGPPGPNPAPNPSRLRHRLVALQRHRLDCLSHTRASTDRTAPGQPRPPFRTLQEGPPLDHPAGYQCPRSGRGQLDHGRRFAPCVPDSTRPAHQPAQRRPGHLRRPVGSVQ